jgi:transposase
MEISDARKIGSEAQREKRRIALNMREQGYTFEAIGQAVGVHARTVQKWISKVGIEGVAAVTAGKSRGYAAGLHRQLSREQEDKIVILITDQMPDQMKLPYALWTRKAVRDLIKDQTGVDMPIRTVGLYLARWGFTPQRPAKKAYEQRSAQVQEWLDETYPEIERRAKAEGAEIFWGDETGVTSRCQHGRSYAPKGQTPVVELTAKRFGVNMISALSNQGKLLFMLYRDNFDAQRCIDFMQRLVASANKAKVFLILDNLRVHHAKLVKEWVEQNKHQIELFYLPAYSPELNPDEYLNGDLKNRIAEKPQARNKDALESSVKNIMDHLSSNPNHVQSYFRHPKIKYAA